MKTSFRSMWIKSFVYSALSIVPTILSAQTDSVQSNCNDNGKVRDFQFSILPFISINSPAENEVVDISINLFGGYVKGVRKFEAGGIINMESCNAENCQLAGVANIVEGKSGGLQASGVMNLAGSQNGCQIAGTLNVVRNNAGNCQLAGVANITGGTFKGLQAAGVMNTCNTYEGAQLSGVFNFTAKDAGNCQIAGVANVAGGNIRGLQGAGVASISRYSNGAQISGVVNATNEVKGAQIAGVANITKDIDGSQLAGVGNIAVNAKGLQIAGVANIADSLEGAQISGCINISRLVKGTQIGVVNLCDSIDGIPIGVFSIAGNGYKKIELSFDELRFANFSFKTGVSSFYNIFSVGIRPGEFVQPLWNFSYGVGTKFNAKNDVSYDLELSAQHIAKGHVRDYMSEIYKIYFGTDWKLCEGISLAAGLSYNLSIFDKDSPQYRNTFSSVEPYSFSEFSYRNGNIIKHWIGGRIALRIL